MAIPRYAILNLVRDRLNIPRVDYRPSGWETSAAAADLQHGEDILVSDLWQAMKVIAADSRDKWERRKIRIIAEQYEYPLPSDCMTALEVMHNFYGDWTELDYLYHNEFFSGFSENVMSYPPRFFTLQAHTSNPVHYQGNITRASGWIGDNPPILIDTSANFGITLTGEDINPGDKIFNLTDDGSGYVYYLSASTWDRSAQADNGSTATTLYDADAAFTSSPVVKVGDIVARLAMPADDYPDYGAWGVVTKVSADTLTFNHLYNHEAGFVATDYYKIGKADMIYLTSAGLVKDTEEGLVGGADGTFGVGTAVVTSSSTTFGANSATFGAGVSLSSVTVAMAVESTNSAGEFTGGEVASVVGQVVTLTANWSNGTPTNGTGVKIGTGDQYQVEDYYSTLDTLLLDSVPSTTDTLGTESLMLIYIPYPKQPLKYYHPVELSEAYTPAIVAKILEFAKARERGEEPRYEWLLDKGIGMRKLYNKGRLGHKRTHRRYPTNITSYQLENMVDQRGIT